MGKNMKFGTIIRSYSTSREKNLKIVNLSKLVALQEYVYICSMLVCFKFYKKITLQYMNIYQSDVNKDAKSKNFISFNNE